MYLDHFWKYMLIFEALLNVKFIKMRKLTIFITTVWALFLTKLNDDPGTI